MRACVFFSRYTFYNPYSVPTNGLPKRLDSQFSDCGSVTAHERGFEKRVRSLGATREKYRIHVFTGRLLFNFKNKTISLLVVTRPCERREPLVSCPFYPVRWPTMRCRHVHVAIRRTHPSGPRCCSFGRRTRRRHCTARSVVQYVCITMYTYIKIYRLLRLIFPGREKKIE